MVVGDHQPFRVDDETRSHGRGFPFIGGSVAAFAAGHFELVAEEALEELFQFRRLVAEIRQASGGSDRAGYRDVDHRRLYRLHQFRESIHDVHFRQIGGHMVGIGHDHGRQREPQEKQGQHRHAGIASRRFQESSLVVQFNTSIIRLYGVTVASAGLLQSEQRINLS